MRLTRTGRFLAPAVLALGLLVLVAVLGGRSSRGARAPRTDSGALIARSTRLLPLRVPDPDGGPPWGVRLVSTTNGLLCAQVGRVVDGRLGQLGREGAFHDDGRFHPMAPDDLPEVRAPGTAGDGQCVAHEETFAGEIDGLERNALENPLGDTAKLADRREISFGLLGPHALAITYRIAGETLTRPVLRGLGAYLLVTRSRPSRYLGSTGAAPGGDYADALEPAGPTGSLISITYRFGRTVCLDDDEDTVARCHLPGGPPGPEHTPSQGGI